MAKYKQGSSDRMDESLGMRRGKESGMSQSYKDRRDESKGMSKGGKLKDGTHASPVQSINVPCGQGWSEVKPLKQGNDGYPAKAFDYKY